MRSDIILHQKEAHVVGDFVYDLHCAGLREVSNLALGCLIKMFYVQASPGRPLKPSIGAFNLLRLESQHCRANKKLLEDVCLAHASWAEKTGKEVQEAAKCRNIPPLNDLFEGTPIQFNVGFYAANMFKGGPLCNLLSEALMILCIKQRIM